jgi:hypothetical protein
LEGRGVASYSLVDKYQRFGGMYCLLQGRRIVQVSKKYVYPFQTHIVRNRTLSKIENRRKRLMERRRSRAGSKEEEEEEMK